MNHQNEDTSDDNTIITTNTTYPLWKKIKLEDFDEYPECKLPYNKRIVQFSDESTVSWPEILNRNTDVPYGYSISPPQHYRYR